MSRRAAALLMVLALCMAGAALAEDAQAPIVPPAQIPQPPTDQPSAVAPSEPPAGYVAPPEPAPTPPVEGDFIDFEADQIRSESEDGRIVYSKAEGNVTARYRNITVTAQKAEVDYTTNLARFEGNVVFRIDSQEASASCVTLNLKTREWTGLRPIATIQPSFAKGYLLAPVFTSGQSVRGWGQRQADLFGSEATTCNLARPHYQFTAKSMTVYPDNKIIFRSVSMYALGMRLFTVPRFVVPIRQIQRNPNVIPNLGQSVEEGYYLKTAYTLLGTRQATGRLLLDLMSKKGFGKGADYNYKFGSASGSAQVYQIFDRNIDQDTLTGRFNHRQRLGTLDLGLGTDFRSNSYLYAPDSKTLVNRATLTRDRPGANTSLSATESINSTYTRSTNFAGNLRHRQAFGANTSLMGSFDYISFATNNQTRARLTSQGVFSRREHAFDWEISAQKLTDLSDEAFVGRGGFGGIDKLPEVALTSSTARLGNFLFGMPANFRLSYGQYAELPADTERGRTFLEVNTPVNRFKLSPTWDFNAGAGFKQYAYSDNTAQYSLDASAEMVKKYGPSSSFNLTYRYQHPKGYTPFRFDYVGRYNIVNAGLNLRDNKKFRASVLTGYNFTQQSFPWQDVTIRFTAEPTNSFLFYTSTGYDLNRSRWRTLINQIRIRAKDTFKLDIGTRYDTTLNQLATAKINMDTRLWRNWRVQGVAGYNGFTKAFDYRSVMLTRDLHCWEASIMYVDQGGFYTNQGVTFSLRIKAFPTFTAFGAGAFGQAQDTSVGEVY